jgi:hypothetical protein
MQVISDDMIAVAVSTALFPIFTVGHVMRFRRRRKDIPGYTHLPISFGLYAIVAIALEAIIIGPADITLFDVASGLSTVGFFCLGYMQIFSLTCRGFSLCILADVRKHNGLDLNGILREYSDGRGIDWLLEKRLSSLEKLHLLQREGNTLILGRPYGLWIGTISSHVKQLLKIAPGG